MFKTMTKKEFQEADKRLEKGIREFAQLCEFRDNMTKIFGK